MNREQKKQAVSDLDHTFGANETVVVAHYSGLTVAELSAFRGQLRQAGASFKVTKNRLAKIALKGSRFETINDLFKGPTGIAVSQDPIAAAKVAYEFAKGNDKLVILGGQMGTTVLDAAGVEALAKMPSLDELRGRLVGMIVTPATRIATIAQVPASQVARVINAYAQKG